MLHMRSIQQSLTVSEEYIAETPVQPYQSHQKKKEHTESDSSLKHCPVHVWKPFW